MMQSTMMPLRLANIVFRPMLLWMCLLSSASCIAAETAVSSTPMHSYSGQKYIRRWHHQQRRAQKNADNNDEHDEWYLPDTDLDSAASDNNEKDNSIHGEWYLPDMKLNLKKTWLFGAGDPSEWGGHIANDYNKATNIATEGTLVPAPINVPLFEGDYITDISAGGEHSAIITNEGRILTAGSSSAGEDMGLGRDTKDGAELGFMPITEVYPLYYNVGDHNNFTRLATSEMPPFVKVVASQSYTIALDEEGNVWSTGDNAYAQLCLNDTISRDRFHQVKLPAENLFDQGNKVVDIILGQRHTLLLREDGKVYGCGWNQYGQLGIGVKGTNVMSPVEIVIDAPDEDGDTNENETDTASGNGGRQINHEVITDVVAGRGSSYFLTSSGHVYATGTNYKGQLCLGHRLDRTLPTILANVETFLSRSGSDVSLRDEGVGVVDIAAGTSSFYLALSNGMVLACGENTQGQLGIGNNNDADAVDVPTVISNVTNVTAVFSGPTSYGAYFVSDRKIYAVGFDGVGARGNWNVPNMMACIDEETTLKKGMVISSGNDHTLYLATVETTFECEGGSAPTTVPTTSPFQTPEPTTSQVPSTTPSASSQPSMSSMPVTIAPSDTPTTSVAPTASSAPSATFDEDATLVPTPFDSFFVTSSEPTMTSAPSPSQGLTQPPVAPEPERALPINPDLGNGARGHSVGGFGLSLLAVCSMWQLL